MSSAKTEYGHEFECDMPGCHETFSPPALGRGSEPRDFRESWELARGAGWRARKNGRDEWEHHCPSCAG